MRQKRLKQPSKKTTGTCIWKSIKAEINHRVCTQMIICVWKKREQVNTFGGNTTSFKHCKDFIFDGLRCERFAFHEHASSRNGIEDLTPDSKEAEANRKRKMKHNRKKKCTNRRKQKTRTK